jgi:hypothetical protein
MNDEGEMMNDKVNILAFVRLTPLGEEGRHKSKIIF